ncbi:MAG: hypothetical protein JNM27_20845 [Leptospirales bacterium]|nr:hypothetical protein [Leptospirales bacterium]
MLDRTIQDLLRSREAAALRFSIYGHLTLIVLMSTVGFIIAQSAFEARYTLIISA